METITQTSGETFAHTQATAIVFESLGDHDSAASVFDAIKAAFGREAAEGSRGVERGIYNAIENAGVRFREPYNNLLLPSIKGTYDELVARLQEVKPVEQPSYMDRPIVDCTVMDWRVSEGEPLEKLPPHHRDAYNLRITKSRHQAFLDLTNLRGENEAQMAVYVEINEGLPCLHIASSLYDDPLLSIFSTKEGLYVRADAAAPNLAKNLRGQMAQLSGDFTVNYGHNTGNDRVYRA